MSDDEADDVSEEAAGEPRDSLTSIEPFRPKRGAFPTPKSEIEKATPFVPDVGNEDDPGEVKADPSMDIDDQGEG